MTLYARWILNWERRLTLKDPHRRIFPFEWGLDWIEGLPAKGDGPLDSIKTWVDGVMADSESFFQVSPIAGAHFQDSRLVFASPTPGPYPENNTAVCRLWKVEGSQAAVVVIPQWNADANSHVGLCRFLSRLGFTTVRMTMPYHESRAPKGMQRADLMVSPNLGRTLHATRQAVLEVLQIVRWLQQEGFEQVALVGTSLGSCVAYLAFVHDCSICTAVFNHVSAFFADVVWSGLSTRFVRWGLEGNVTLEDLRRCWTPLSPWPFIERLRECRRPHLLITARYDLSFLPELADPVFDQYSRMGIVCDSVELPCGHYTTAHFPFKYLDGWHICRFLRNHLGSSMPRNEV